MMVIWYDDNKEQTCGCCVDIWNYIFFCEEHTVPSVAAHCLLVQLEYIP